jgi:hypothetical protein
MEEMEKGTREEERNKQKKQKETIFIKNSITSLTLNISIIINN